MGFEGPEGDKYSVLKFDNGERCWQGTPARAICGVPLKGSHFSPWDSHVPVLPIGMTDGSRVCMLSDVLLSVRFS